MPKRGKFAQTEPAHYYSLSFGKAKYFFFFSRKISFWIKTTFLGNCTLWTPLLHCVTIVNTILSVISIIKEKTKIPALFQKRVLNYGLVGFGLSI